MSGLFTATSRPCVGTGGGTVDEAALCRLVNLSVPHDGQAQGSHPNPPHSRPYEMPTFSHLAPLRIPMVGIGITLNP